MVFMWFVCGNFDVFPNCANTGDKSDQSQNTLLMFADLWTVAHRNPRVYKRFHSESSNIQSHRFSQVRHSSWTARIKM